MNPYFSDSDNLKRLQSVASTWLHTPFMPNAAVKGAGVSCQKLVGAIYIESGFLPKDFAVPEGPMDWSAAQKTSLIAEFMNAQPQFEMAKLPAQPGDMIGFKLGGCVHHCGVMLFPDGKFIHCFRSRGTIISNLRDATYSGRIERVWRPIVVGSVSPSAPN